MQVVAPQLTFCFVFYKRSFISVTKLLLEANLIIRPAYLVNNDVLFIYLIELFFEITLCFCNTVMFYGHANKAQVLLLL